MKLSGNLCAGAGCNTCDNDKIGDPTDCHVEQLESWFDAGQLALHPSVRRHFQCTCCVPEASLRHFRSSIARQ